MKIVFFPKMLLLYSYEKVADFFFFFSFFKCFNVVVTIGAFSVYASDSQQEVTEGVFGPFIVWKKLQYC